MSTPDTNAIRERATAENPYPRDWTWALALTSAVKDITALCDALDAAHEALRKLEQWDMLSLSPDGHGAATADAPWARKLIREALDR